MDVTKIHPFRFQDPNSDQQVSLRSDGSKNLCCEWKHPSFCHKTVPTLKFYFDMDGMRLTISLKRIYQEEKDGTTTDIPRHVTLIRKSWEDSFSFSDFKTDEFDWFSLKEKENEIQTELLLGKVRAQYSPRNPEELHEFEIVESAFSYFRRTRASLGL